MDIQQTIQNLLQTMPMPRTLSVILVCGTIGAGWFSHVKHEDVNLWIATAVGVCALLNYGITWYFKIKNKK